ncbi:acetylornithine deacetylase [Nocardia sp. NBC_01499]|uniref:acetylornithine deacetylase n=1 Tax=Nocardia sp. NBC_01499 TaxID=2903597 RepID=UPI00386670EC
MSSGIFVRCSDDDLYSHMLAILERLVGFDTTSSNSNIELVHYVQELISENGISSQLYWNEEHTKASLVATAGARSNERGVIWSAHTDVVPVEGQSWSADPFELRIEQGVAIGRGTADMKGFIACCLAILSRVDQSGLTTPITLMLTYDEEVGCVGARQLVDEMRTWAGVKGCIVGEPTGLEVVVGHKGKQIHKVRFIGESRHAALAPQVTNPIVSSVSFVGTVQALNERFRSEGPHDDRFDIGHSWINVGRIFGGLKANIVPEDCVLELEIRNVPGHDCDRIAAELMDHVGAGLCTDGSANYEVAEVSTEQLSDTPSFTIDPAHEFVTFVRRSFGAEQDPLWVPFGTEAGIIWGCAGIPAVVCGPGFITEAHTANEFISLDQLSKCLRYLQSLPLV